MKMEESWCSVDNAAISLTEMICLKKNQQQKEDAANSPCLGRQELSPSSPVCTNDAAAHIKVGSYYEIDHSKLSRRTPDQLRSIRIIVVSKKSKNSVSLRFPSIHSLRDHFSERNRRKTEKNMLPAMDEKHVMGLELAGEVLYRRVPPHQISVRRKEWSFWVMMPSDDKEKIPSTASINKLCSVVSKKGLCWSQLSSTGMVKWGNRRQVRYLSRHLKEKDHEATEQIVSSSPVSEGQEVKSEENIKDDEEEEDAKEAEEIDDYEENVNGDNDSGESTKRNNRKRKRQRSTHKAKRVKREKRYQTLANQRNTKENRQKNFIDRWSLQRYKLAEKNMLKVLKEKGAVFGNSILRPALRSEARKLIGDTGLLDHLLKHMAGKVAPGGQERFMRRHNADGAMEYWLESADLVNIRKEAGVQDPYWTPPAGWKPGDNPTQDPVCAREIKELRERVAKLEREMEQHISKKQEEDLATVTTLNSIVTSETRQLDNSIILRKEMYTDLINKKAQIEDQLMKISQMIVQGERPRPESIVQEPGSNKAAGPTQTPLLFSVPPPPSSSTNKETTAVTGKNQESEIISEKEEERERLRGKAAPPAPPFPPLKTISATEDMASKIERLKSGFRICKPQGSFLWPNMGISPTVPLEDILPVPTPPSSSTTPTAPSPTHLASPFKPLAERRHFIVPTPLIPHETTTHNGKTNSYTSINLNELPENHGEGGFCLSQYQNLGPSNTSPARLTYQRRQLFHG